MLGHKLVQTLRSTGHEAVPTIRGELGDSPAHRVPILTEGHTIERFDVADEVALRRLVDEEDPDAILNAVGVIKQRGEAKEAVPSIRINALLPHLLAELGPRLIHFSTDCVFDGTDGDYTEGSLPNAADLYGRSKQMGEVTDNPNALTLRTSIIGRELGHFGSLVEWFLAQDGKPVRGFRRAIYTGLTTNAMAGLVVKLLDERPDLSGLWHVAAPKIDKYELLLKLQAAFGTHTEIVPDDTFVLDRSLDASRFWRETGWTQPSWDRMIEDMAQDPTPYTAWGLRS